MSLSLSPAAVCQCFTLVSLCTSIADPNWIQVQNGTDPSSGQLIYGVAFTIHPSPNVTDTSPLGGVNGWGMWLLYTLAAICYGAVLLSSSSFLLDFLGAGVSHSHRLVTLLHISTAVLCLAALGVCGACLSVIHYNLHHKARAGRSGAPLWQGGPGPQLYPGESFYIELLGTVFAFLACGFSVGCRPDAAAGPARDYLAVEDRETEPLIRGARRTEAQDEAFRD